MHPHKGRTRQVGATDPLLSLLLDNVQEVDQEGDDPPQRKAKATPGPRTALGEMHQRPDEVLFASYNANGLNEGQWDLLCNELERLGVAACAIQETKLRDVNASWNQSKYVLWANPCYEGPCQGAAGGVAWAICVRDGIVRCASVARLGGSGPIAKWVTFTLAGQGGCTHTLQLASVYILPHPAMGKSKDAIRDEVLVALDGAAGQRAVLMGDINCDCKDWNAEGRAWESALEGAGYVAFDQQNGWGKISIPTRMHAHMPWVPKDGNKKARGTGTPRHLDVVLASGPIVANLDPLMVAIGTDSKIDTPGYGACPCKSVRSLCLRFGLLST